ncbi:hypothetical protein ABEB36_007977 [Hypothenemus hampei]|uniref:Uncharacterized protein n=1 Tax=Hypothenemus hampei TaxID=57062 RepID=A0ABD1EKQ9_HYPHA
MGMFFPCLFASILNASVLQIFRKPVYISNGPLMALYIFIFTTFILLWSIRLYPSSLRKIGKLHFLIEFFVAEFLMEDLIIDFWFPLEKFFLDGLPIVAQYIDDWALVGDWSFDAITDFLRSETCGFYVSYSLALFFLLATLYASRVIDLRTLTRKGPIYFFKEIIRKIQNSVRKVLRKMGFNQKRKVKINERKNTHREIEFETYNQKKLSSSPGSNRRRSSRKNGKKRSQFGTLHNSRLNENSELEDVPSISDLEYCPF